jgi:hypothetical protein
MMEARTIAICYGHRATTALIGGHGSRRIGAKDAELTLSGLQTVATPLAIVDVPTGVRPHGLITL